MPGIGKTPTERDLNDVFEVELNFIGGNRIGEPIERFIQRGLEFSEYTYDSADSIVVQQTARS